MQRGATDAELAVLEVLWEHDQATVRQITEILYPDCGSSDHSTVQKLLDRLRAKRCVVRDRSVWPHRFSATIEREQLIGRGLAAVAEKLCGGSLQPLLSHLVRNVKLSADERTSLRKMLDELERKSGGSRGAGG